MIVSQSHGVPSQERFSKIYTLKLNSLRLEIGYIDFSKGLLALSGILSAVEISSTAVFLSRLLHVSAGERQYE